MEQAWQLCARTEAGKESSLLGQPSSERDVNMLAAKCATPSALRQRDHCSCTQKCSACSGMWPLGPTNNQNEPFHTVACCTCITLLPTSIFMISDCASRAFSSAKSMALPSRRSCSRASVRLTYWMAHLLQLIPASRRAFIVHQGTAVLPIKARDSGAMRCTEPSVDVTHDQIECISQQHI